MDLIIKTLTETRSLRVEPSCTVGSLKQLIYQTLGISPLSQRLCWDNGSRTPLSNDSMRLCDYGLQSGSLVAVLITDPPIQVFLKNEKGVTSTYDILPEETVEGFKVKVQHKEGVPTSQQRLIHEGKEMADGRKLSDYGVKSLSTIYLTLRLRGG